ncbi:hypothetical protein OPKNFCMD_1927 [Methylobacterium crusticola]|uniref:UrcA family protein n=1 Tax=Methylobacterium crusticola TaxID=1697972 RepID=A0ABQ4QV20_9HYPH|nr:hypothetical protein [Methylobacterium crusticola]GJD49197.1 hypothetical protein OPKNFCMD_1927 [Methylobacterium crusticola]
MRLPALALLTLAATGAGLAAAAAEPLPLGETTYVERSLERDATLTVEHPPVPRNPRGRRAARSAEIAGFCRDGGLVRRYDAAGQVIVRQRELCDNVAPRSLYPGFVDPRPAWPAEPVVVVRSKG